MTAPPADVQPHRHYTAKHRVVAWISQNVFGNVTYTVRHGLIQGMKRKGGLGWLPQSLSGSAWSLEHDFWARLDLKDLVVYDIGAYQGLLTMFFARQARTVISYEPNSNNHARLLENLKLNSLTNVLVRNLGVGSKAEVLTMVSNPLMTGGASVEPETVAGLLNSNTPVVSEQITITTLDEDITRMSLPAPEFVKIDVEGQEIEALKGASSTLRRFRPRLFLEMHGETMQQKLEKAAALVAYLKYLGYAEIVHVETGAKLDESNSGVAAEGHLYCV